MSDADLVPVSHEKVLKYETFLNDVLKRELERINKERDSVFEELSDILQLRNTLQVLQDTSLYSSGKSFRTQVDLGCNFYVQAEVPDTSKVLVEVGFGFYLELTIPEALAYIDKKEAVLNCKAEDLGKKGAEVKADIRLVLEGLAEIQGLSEKRDIERGPIRDIFA